MKIKLVTICAGFLFGLIYFFPWNPLKEKLATTLTQVSGAQIDIGSLSASTGYMVGISKGSLFGIKGSNVSIAHPAGIDLNCEKLYLAPRLLPLFMGSVQIGVKCTLEKDMSISSLLKAYPFWGAFTGAISDINIEVTADNFPLEKLSALPGTDGIAGKLSGNVNLSEIQPLTSSLPGSIEWEINIEGLQTPALDHSMAKIPSLAFSSAETQGSMTPRTLNIEKLSLGSAANPLELHVALQEVQLDPQFNPRKGKFKGSIRIDPTYESERLSKISWNSAFGPADAQGRREFTRTASGAWHRFLLFGAPD